MTLGLQPNRLAYSSSQNFIDLSTYSFLQMGDHIYPLERAKHNLLNFFLPAHYSGISLLFSRETVRVRREINTLWSISHLSTWKSRFTGGWKIFPSRYERKKLRMEGRKHTNKKTCRGLGGGE